MSFDEQPYNKEDHDLHDACEEIKRLTADLARVTGERENLSEHYNNARNLINGLERQRDAEREKNAALTKQLSECLCWESEACPLHSVGIAIVEAKYQVERARAKGLERQIDRLAKFHVPPNHEHESGTVNPDGDCWVCHLQSPSPAKECQDCIGPGHDVCYEHPPAVEKPCATCNGSGSVFPDPMTDEPANCRDCPPAVAPVESLTDDEGGK